MQRACGGHKSGEAEPREEQVPCVWREGCCGLQGADRGSSLWLLWGLGLHSKTSEAMKSLKKDVTGSDLGF